MSKIGKECLNRESAAPCDAPSYPDINISFITLSVRKSTYCEL